MICVLVQDLMSLTQSRSTVMELLHHDKAAVTWRDGCSASC